MVNQIRQAASIFLCIMGVGLGCGQQEKNRDIVIRFSALVGEKQALCDTTYTGLGPNKDQSIQFKDFRFYIHDIELIRKDGASFPVTMQNKSPWQTADVALLDFENQAGLCSNGTPELNTEIHGTVENQEYTGIRFILGVPFALNHQDASIAQPPMNLTSLFWNWQGGYKFARIDAETVSSVASPKPTVSFHLASTSCDGSASGGVTQCLYPNRSTIELTQFDVDKSVIVADYASLVGNLDLEKAGCMSSRADAGCEEFFASVGLQHGNSAPKQDFFRIKN